MRLFHSATVLAGLSLLFATSAFAGPPTGAVKVVQRTPGELAEFGITFEKLGLTFPSPVTAQFWIEYDPGQGPKRRSDLPSDHMLPSDHYVVSYVQLADNQVVALSVTSDSESLPGRRTVEFSGANQSSTGTVVSPLSSLEVAMDQDIELFRATTKPSWRHPGDPTTVLRAMARFSDAEFDRDPIPLEDHAGWQLVTEGRLAVLRRARNSFDWKDVSPPILAEVVRAAPDPSFWDGYVDLAAWDANEAWVAVVTQPGAHPQGVLEHTTDGGKHWHQTATPAMEAVNISFPDPGHGFLLALGSPALSQMAKAVYETTDGGTTWKPLASPGGEGQGFYPTGMVFRTPQEGWITATYHGPPDAPLFHTRDGGRTWQVQQLEIPPDFRGGYADIYPPYFYPRSLYPDQMKGQLPVKLVRHTPAPDHERWLYYHTEDGGASWHLPVPAEPTSPN